MTSYELLNHMKAVDAEPNVKKALGMAEEVMKQAYRTLNEAEGRIQDLEESQKTDAEKEVLDIFFEGGFQLCLEDGMKAAAERYGYSSEEYEAFEKLLSLTRYTQQ